MFLKYLSVSSALCSNISGAQEGFSLSLSVVFRVFLSG